MAKNGFAGYNILQLCLSCGIARRVEACEKTKNIFGNDHVQPLL
jgi:hypothetical protein